MADLTKEKAMQQSYDSGTETRESVIHSYIDETVDENGALHEIAFKNADDFNFAYDIADVLAESDPDKMCMLWIDKNRNEKRFSFADMKRYSNKTANYFSSLGIRKGDRVMLVLKRHYQFWFAVLALHKIGAVVIPATHMLREEDFAYRFKAGKLRAIVCTGQDDAPGEAEKAITAGNFDIIKIMADPRREICREIKCLSSKENEAAAEITAEGQRAAAERRAEFSAKGWHDFDEEMLAYSEQFERTDASGDDPMLMFFTSGTTSYPKLVTHNFKYALGHYITAKYWQHVDPDGIHFTLAETGWGKALWGKLYGQWMCEAAVFVYDMEEYAAHDFLSLFGEYPITTFCAPPTAYRIMAKRKLSKYDLSRLQYVTTAGEALSSEIWQQFYDKTGLKIREGFGQTETTLTLATLWGTEPKPGAMGKPSPMYEIDLVDEDGKSVPGGETGEIVVRTDQNVPCGLFMEYFGNEDKIDEVWYDDMYHTGDRAYKDEDGYYWYVGRTDDVIKSSGYRVGPHEVESVLMELPCVLECAVVGVPDRQRGYKIKATIVLTDEYRDEIEEKGPEGEKHLRAEISRYAKQRMANYKCPRIIDFTEELPKTISGKIRRSALRGETSK